MFSELEPDINIVYRRRRTKRCVWKQARFNKSFVLNEVARHWFSEVNFTTKSWLPKPVTLLRSIVPWKFLNKIFHSNLIPFKIDLVFKGSFTLSIRSRSVCSSNVTKWDQQVCLNIFKNARQDVVSKNKKKLTFNHVHVKFNRMPLRKCKKCWWL